MSSDRSRRGKRFIEALAQAGARRNEVPLRWTLDLLHALQLRKWVIAFDWAWGQTRRVMEPQERQPTTRQMIGRGTRSGRWCAPKFTASAQQFLRQSEIAEQQAKEMVEAYRKQFPKMHQIYDELVLGAFMDYCKKDVVGTEDLEKWKDSVRAAEGEARNV